MEKTIASGYKKNNKHIPFRKLSGSNHHHKTSTHFQHGYMCPDLNM